jgi:ankyrin repeat protein
VFLEIALRKQHYVQACAHTVILAYWGWYWRPVYQWAPLILGQLLFAYAFDMLLTWSRRETYTLGFGPFPIIGSINLFLWFKPDWYYLQLAMVAVAFIAKEFVRWNKDGRRVHIFNPSSFPLSIVSVVLLLTRSTSITYGEDIATTLLEAPYIYIVIFLVSLPGQLLFGVTTMTMAAVAVTYLCSLVYYQMSGVYFFADAFIPIAVFLGMHLLFTDPSTAPRTEGGRIVFGVLYGLSVIAFFWVLTHFGLPSFYDKLLGVPILNLMIKRIDALVVSGMLVRNLPFSLGGTRPALKRRLGYMTVWCVGFLGLSTLHVNTPEADGTTALHWVVRRNHVVIVRLLLGVGANVNAANNYGVTPLSVAAAGADPAMIRTLVRGGADPNTAVADGLTVLMIAAGTGHVDIVRALLEAGANVNAREPVLGETALIWAAKGGHSETISLLIQSGADINARAGPTRYGPNAASDTSSGGSTALVYAIRRNAQAAARTLVKAGADIDAGTTDGVTPLHLAIIQTELDLAALLLDAGANPNIVDRSGVGPLYAAIDINTIEQLPGALVPNASSLLRPENIIASLLAHGAHPNARLTAPALTRGYRGGNSRIGEGVTPFMRAAWKGDPTAMRLLLQHGADPTLLAASHVTALMFAAGFGGSGTDDENALEERQVEAAKLCVLAGNIDAVNDDGQSALHLAARERGTRFVMFLVEGGARLDIKDRQGQTPLDVARRAGREGTAAYLAAARSRQKVISRSG